MQRNIERGSDGLRRERDHVNLSGVNHKSGDAYFMGMIWRLVSAVEFEPTGVGHYMCVRQDGANNWARISDSIVTRNVKLNNYLSKYSLLMFERLSSS